MDKDTKVSFIPKKPLSGKTDRRARPMSLLLFLSFLIFFITLAAYGGLYFYNSNLQVVLEGKVADLEAAKEKADPTGAIKKAEDLQARINNTKNLLEGHIAPSRVFDLLEEVTLKSVVLNGFTFEKESIDTNQGGALRESVQSAGTSNFVIRTGGNASSYASLAYQSDVLKQDIENNRRIKSFSIKNPSLDVSGNVTFDLDITLDTIFLLYKGAFDNGISNQDTTVTEEITLEEFLETEEDLESFEEVTPEAPETTSSTSTIEDFLNES